MEGSIMNSVAFLVMIYVVVLVVLVSTLFIVEAKSKPKRSINFNGGDNTLSGLLYLLALLWPILAFALICFGLLEGGRYLCGAIGVKLSSRYGSKAD
jgi:hypothetical protein